MARSSCACCISDGRFAGVAVAAAGVGLAVPVPVPVDLTGVAIAILLVFADLVGGTGCAATFL